MYRKTSEDGSVSYYNGRYIRSGETIIVNPTTEILASEGYEWYEPPVQGTEENPYSWSGGGMAEEGKYYESDGKTYVCVKSSDGWLEGSLEDNPDYFTAVTDDAESASADAGQESGGSDVADGSSAESSDESTTVEE